jgi:Cu/Ag efflux protein CusF
MTTMKKLLSAAALMLAASFALAEPVEGEVRKIDKEAGRITLKHGEIKSLDMPPMTMVYRAQPPSLLDKVQVGEKVKFTAEKVGGNYVVTSLTPAR